MKKKDSYKNLHIYLVWMTIKQNPTMFNVSAEEFWKRHLGKKKPIK